MLFCVISSTSARLGNFLCGKKNRLKSQAREMAKKKQMELVKGSGRRTCGNQTPFSVPCSLCSLHFPVGVLFSGCQFGWWNDRPSNELCSPRMLQGLVLVVGFLRSKIIFSCDMQHNTIPCGSQRGVGTPRICIAPHRLKVIHCLVLVPAWVSELQGPTMILIMAWFWQWSWRW